MNNGVKQNKITQNLRSEFPDWALNPKCSAVMEEKSYMKAHHCKVQNTGDKESQQLPGRKIITCKGPGIRKGVVLCQQHSEAVSLKL